MPSHVDVTYVIDASGLVYRFPYWVTLCVSWFRDDIQKRRVAVETRSHPVCTNDYVDVSGLTAAPQRNPR